MNTSKKINGDIKRIIKNNVGLNFEYFDFVLEKDENDKKTHSVKRPRSFSPKATAFYKHISRMI